MSKLKEALSSLKYHQGHKTKADVVEKDYLQTVPEIEDKDKFSDGPTQINEIYETTMQQLDLQCL